MSIRSTAARAGTVAAVPVPVSRGPAQLTAQIRKTVAAIVVADLVVLVATVMVAWQLRLAIDVGLPPADPRLSLATRAGPGIVVTWLVLLTVCGAYSRRVLGAGTEEYRRVLMASLAAAGAVGVFCYLIALDLSRGFLLLSILLGTPALVACRYAARLHVHRLRRRGHLIHRVVAVGGADDLAELTGILDRESHLGFRIVAACTPTAPAEPGSGAQPLIPVQRGSEFGVGVGDVRRACARHDADTVLVARGGYESSAGLRRIAWELEGSRIQLIVVPSLTDVAGPRIHMRPVAGLPLIHLQEPQADSAGGLTKRVFDLVGGLAAVLLLSPLMLAVAVAIKVEDGGAVFYSQRRVGLKGSTFPCLKFRSMVSDADQHERMLREADGHTTALWKARHDPRVTRVGRLIRRYSLDELPQLFNVLAGHMSLVGPRPQQAWEVETYSDSTRRRLLVRPGMTGLWQVSGRSNLSVDEAVRLDLYYVDNWSMASDVVIMVKTAKAVLTSDGAF